MNNTVINFIDRNAYYFLALFVLLLYIAGGVVVQFDRKRVKDKKDKDTFYFGTFSRRKTVERKHIHMDTWYAVIMYIWTATTSILFGALVVQIPGLRGLWNGTGKYVNEFPGIMCTTWLALFGILVVFSTFNKEHWLTFSVSDIMKHFGIEKKMKEMLWTILGTGFLNFISVIFNYEESYFIYFGFRFAILVGFVYYIILFCIICVILIESFFGNKIESKFLDFLYRELWYRPVKKIKREWSYDTVETYVEYLCNEFCYYMKKVKANTITEICYASNICDEEGGYQKDRFNCLRKKCASFFAWGLGFFLFVMMLIETFSIAKSDLQIEICEVLFGIAKETVLIVGLGIGLYALGLNKNVSTFLVSVVFGRCGYEIKFGEKKVRYVREVAFREWEKNFKYIHSIKNIVTFCYLAIEARESKAINIMIERCNEEQKKHPDIVVPILVIDYIYERMCQKEAEKKEKSLGDNVEESLIAMRRDIKFEIETVENMQLYKQIAKEIAQDIERSIMGEKVNKANFEQYAKKWKE